jgi:hypothetical protein
MDARVKPAHDDGESERREKKEQAMTPDQIKLVQQSFSKVAPISEQAAVIFYDRLFEVAPTGRPQAAE